jgi:hypothetical protein
MGQSETKPEPTGPASQVYVERMNSAPTAEMCNEYKRIAREDNIAIVIVIPKDKLLDLQRFQIYKNKPFGLYIYGMN